MKHVFENCFQCVSYTKCFEGNKQLELDVAREKAKLCTRPFKGLGTDMVQVWDTPKCISLKKALRFFHEGRVEWLDHHTVGFIDER